MPPRMIGRLFSAVLLAGTFTVAQAASEPSDEKINAFFMLALGRLPTAQEVVAERADPCADIQALFEKHLDPKSDLLPINSAAWHDVFGEETMPVSRLLNMTYVQQVAHLMKHLSQSPDEYETVIHRAYQHVVRRDAYEEEIAYWSEQPATLPYILLVGSVEDWAKRNQPGLMVTAGTPTVSVNSQLLTTQRLSPTEAATITSALDWPEDMTLLAPGGANVKSGGGIYQVVIGQR